MPRRELHLDPIHAGRIRDALDQIYAELQIPQDFPAEAQQEATAAAKSAPLTARDRTDIPFVTIDPPTSMDLDQAVHLSRAAGGGYLVRYAIADVASFVRPGGPIDLEAHRRGVTFYGPDRRAPLHPVELSEGAASLLPDRDRPALVWEHRLDSSGALISSTLTRAVVRSRARLSYEQVQRELDADTAGDILSLLPEIGRLREELELARGGVSLRVPQQEIVAHDGGYAVEFDSPLPVERWNAHVSLLTGMAAAAMMRAGRVGVFRTLPQAQQRDVARLRRTAKALGIDWPRDMPYTALIHSLDPRSARQAAFLNEAASLFRGSRYTTFEGSVPEDAGHAALAAEYAHVTAPLRRLVDRYGLEICAALAEGREVPEWVRGELGALPEVMQDTGRRAGAYEGACVAIVEAAVLTGREDELFRGVVVDLFERKDRGEVVIQEPAVKGRVDGAYGADLPLGEDVTVRLAEASIEARRVAFELV